MKFTNIAYEKKITAEEKSSISQYGNELLRIEGIVEDGENIDICILQLMERTHKHLGVKFESKVLDQLTAAKKPVEKVLTKKDTTPSEEPKERPEPVEVAKEEILTQRAEGETKEKAPKKEEVKAEPKKEEPKVETVEAEVIEEPKKKAPKKTKAPKQTDLEKLSAMTEGVGYNRDDVTHKKEYVRIVTELFPMWREDASINTAVKAASRTLEGKIMFLGSGKINSKFSKALMEVVQ